MQKLRKELSQLQDRAERAVQTLKKWGLVIAKFAIRSPVPRSALFLK
jgi:hypothetical protein